jgi:hypothetical protein
MEPYHPTLKRRPGAYQAKTTFRPTLPDVGPTLGGVSQTAAKPTTKGVRCEARAVLLRDCGSVPTRRFLIANCRISRWPNWHHYIHTMLVRLGNTQQMFQFIAEGGGCPNRDARGNRGPMLRLSPKTFFFFFLRLILRHRFARLAVAKPTSFCPICCLAKELETPARPTHSR